MQTFAYNMIAVFGLANWDFVMTVALSIGIFVTVFLLVLAIFSQSGTIQMSPLREAAIATGHDDRKTMFENPYMRPLLWLLLVLSHRVRLPILKDWLRQALVSSGNPSYFTAEEYLAMSLFNGIVVGLMLTVLNVIITGQFGPGWLIVGIVAGLGLTLAQLYSRSSARLHEISRRVPYSLDLIALAMGAGATFIEAVRTVAREDRTDPFNVELNTMLTEIDLGASRRKALENLSQRVPLTSLRSIVASVIQAEELGTPLSEVLHAQASLLRLQRTVQAENAAAVASVRILVPSLLILISVVLTLFAPAIIRFVKNGGFF
jgi:tight adherence protein C